jgi:SAM-dependent methyltransferase
MHSKVFAEIESICRERVAGGDVLEIGAVPSADSLLCLPALSNARSKVGVNLQTAASYRDFQIRQANANHLDCFADSSFDTVLSNAVHEHDARFWLSLAEIRRVTRPGGLIVIGVPGYAKLPMERTLRRISKLWLPRNLRDALAASTITLQNHDYPGDYYRFSAQAVREVFLDGLRDTEVRTLLLPPRIIGVGVKP